MGQMIISSQEVRRKKEELERLSHRLRTQIGQLEETGHGLHSMWEGDAKESYLKNFDIDLEKMKRLLKAILEFIQVLEKIIELYKAMESKNVATANS